MGKVIHAVARFRFRASKLGPAGGHTVTKPLTYTEDSSLEERCREIIEADKLEAFRKEVYEITAEMDKAKASRARGWFERLLAVLQGKPADIPDF